MLAIVTITSIISIKYICLFYLSPFAFLLFLVFPHFIDLMFEFDFLLPGPRRSIIISDKRLPSGWEKHFTQRKAGTSAGKWDVLFIQ